jgi:hypothetical protein
MVGGFSPVVGGFSGASEERVEGFLSKLHSEIEAKAGQGLRFKRPLKVLEVKQQVVAGINFLVDCKAECQVGEGQGGGEGEGGGGEGGVVTLRLKIFEPLPHTGQEAELTKVELIN